MDSPMSLYVPESAPPIVTGAMIRIERMLPYPGEVLAREGTRVEPDDIVARSFLPVPPHVINVAQSLAIPPSLIEDVMLYEVGDTVSEGEDLAQADLLSGGRRCSVPVSGIVAGIDSETGYVTIAPDPVEFHMSANIRGVVMEVRPHEGVVIETVAAQVYGVFGVGQERSGVLQLFVTDPDEVITHEHQIDARNAYTILIGGAGITAAALKKAVQAQVRGVIVGGIDEYELRSFLRWRSQGDWQAGGTNWKIPDPQRTPDPGLTLMVTEGFGVRPMSTPIFELLSDRDRQEALIDGTTQLRYPMRRPRLVISVSRSSEAQLDIPQPDLRVGAVVRLLDTDHIGQVATVHFIPSVPVRIQSGVHTAAVEVVQEGAPPFFVPQSAVEVLV